MQDIAWDDNRPGNNSSEQMVQKAISKRVLMPTTYSMLQVRLKIASAKTRELLSSNSKH